MDKQDQLELLSGVHALSVTVTHLCGRMIALESTVEAIAKLQQDIAIRSGGNPALAAASFEKAKNDAFARLSEIYAKQMKLLSAQALKAGRKSRNA